MAGVVKVVGQGEQAGFEYRPVPGQPEKRVLVVRNQQVQGDSYLPYPGEPDVFVDLAPETAVDNSAEWVSASVFLSWLLATGVWNDDAPWNDDSTWIDGVTTT